MSSNSWLDNGVFLLIMSVFYTVFSMEPTTVGLASGGIVLVTIGIIIEYTNRKNNERY